MNVTHILTLDICPLPVHITELPFLKTKYIHGEYTNHNIKVEQQNCDVSVFFCSHCFSLPCDLVSDTPKDDLLCHFEECFSFLDDALSNDKVVLVHWFV